MLTIRTAAIIMFLSVAMSASATNDAPASKSKSNSTSNTVNTTAAAAKTVGVNYAFKLDNSINKNNKVDSVLVILDKFDRTGAGIVRKVFYPNADNQVVIDDLPAGKYYAEIYVLGIYKKHFSTVINTEKVNKKNKLTLQMDYTDVYVPGNVTMPAEDTKNFSFGK